MKSTLKKYIESKGSTLTTTEILKDGFERAFKMQDKNGFVIIKNNRRKSVSILIGTKEYAKMINQLENLKEQCFDEQASKIKPSNLKFVDNDSLDF